MLAVLIVLVITVAIYLLKRNYEYWEKRGVPGPKPRFFVGNFGESFLMKKSPTKIFTDIYQQYPDAALVGCYRAGTPVAIIRDPDLVKEVMIKSFHYFQNNDFNIDKNSDPLFGRSPFLLKGDEWKIVRNLLTPGFTSGKMKWIYPHLEEISRDMIHFLEKQEKTYEAKELCTRFTLNNVATCAFGIEGKCFVEKNSEFRQLAHQFLTPGGWALTVFTLITLFPAVAKIISVRITPKIVEKKLIEIVSQALKYRKENNVVRNDFLHNISQLKETCKEFEFTDVDVTAHAAGFFADGYETSSIVMHFLLYELAANPEIQTKLREEINKNFAENDDHLPYEVLQSMTYLDAIFYENLRMHPPALSLQKVCTSSYTYVPKDTDQIKKSVIIEQGTPVVIPMHALHHDPKHFDDPETFNPERFIGANKEKIKKCTFLPFGEGPRSCLGQRFGRLQIKAGVAYIVKNFKLTVNKKTKVPFEYDPTNLLVIPVGGLWIDFEKIA